MHIYHRCAQKIQERRLDRFLELSAPEGHRVHLGCGEKYLKGYINIDLPPSNHTVMQNVRPDVCADIRHIHFRPESVAVIRSHHVLEHFDRPTALAMLIEWYYWLQEGGIVVIETPDLTRAIRRVCQNKSNVAAGLGPLRHIFGSQEASWAFHLDGWYKEKFVFFLEHLGYRDVQVMQFSQGNLDNIIVKARKRQPFAARHLQIYAADELLSYSLIVREKEQLVLDLWMRLLRERLHAGK